MCDLRVLTWNFCMISKVGFFCHSSTLISGCCSRSDALGVLICRFTLECFGISNSSKLLNSGILCKYEHMHTHADTQTQTYKGKVLNKNCLCCCTIVISISKCTYVGMNIPICTYINSMFTHRFQGAGNWHYVYYKYMLTTLKIWQMNAVTEVLDFPY